MFGSDSSVGPFVAAVGASVLVSLIVSTNPRYGGLLLALVVFAMLTAGITRGTIELEGN